MLRVWEHHCEHMAAFRLAYGHPFDHNQHYWQFREPHFQSIHLSDSQGIRENRHTRLPTQSTKAFKQEVRRLERKPKTQCESEASVENETPMAELDKSPRLLPAVDHHRPGLSRRAKGFGERYKTWT